jgi:MoxR-like ATPase
MTAKLLTTQMLLMGRAEKVNLPEDKGYAAYVVEDTFDNGQTSYRAYGKYGSRGSNRWRIAPKVDGVTLINAVSAWTEMLSDRERNGYVLLPVRVFRNEAALNLVASKVHVTQTKSAPYPVCKNQILLASQDDERGIPAVPYEQQIFSGPPVGSESKVIWTDASVKELDSMPEQVSPVSPVSQLSETDLLKEKMQQLSDEVSRRLAKDVGMMTDGNHPMIPKYNGYIWDEQGLKQMTLFHKDNSRLLLVGPGGSGKSKRVEDFLGRIKQPLLRVNLNGQVTPSDLIGHYVVKNGETQWVDGSLPLAMKNGYALLIDEVDFAEPQVLALLHPVLEPDGVLLIKENANETVVPHPNFRLYATANSLGIHDEAGIYTGTNAMNAAFLDRWEIVRMDYLTKDQEVAVFVQAGHSIEFSRKLAEAAEAVRSAITRGEITGICSTRRMIQFAKKFKDFKVLKDAFETSIGGHFSPVESKAVWGILERFFKSKYAAMS